MQALAAAAELERAGRALSRQREDGRRASAELVEELVALLPEGPFLYPPDEQSDQSLELRLAELVREQVLLRTREELPHAVEVEIDEIEEREDGLLRRPRARLGRDRVAEGASSSARAGGWSARSAPPRARRSSALLGRRVHLDLNVRVRKGWRRDEGLLDRLGIE